MKHDSHSNSSNAWVQLYQARRITSDPQSRPPGRPPSLVPRHKVGLTLSKGEIAELTKWENRFSKMLNRKVSLGETVGILARICSNRLAQVSGEKARSLDELVALIISGE
ncbi:MAG: hypothetical protein BGO78_11920 [Chloroflexi bacterium 44-23]|nr:MAG: hypothetical protein BGO78_11920 [Chloroflexi bacterium 44-23]